MVAALMLVLVTEFTGSPGMASLKPAAPARQSVSVGVTLRCPGAVPVYALIQAKTQVLRIFRMVDLDIAWHGCALPSEHTPTEPAAEHAPTPSPLALTVVILPRSMADRLQPDDEKIGMAPGTATARGQLAYVFYDRQLRVTRAIDLLAHRARGCVGGVKSGATKKSGRRRRASVYNCAS
jgi:hypothetical protein